LGSGTLVSFLGKHAILTAAHVIEEFKDMSEIGLCLQTQAHRLTLPKSHPGMIHIGWSGHITALGPDLALVQLRDTRIALLRAQKSFYELRQRTPLWDGPKSRELMIVNQKL